MSRLLPALILFLSLAWIPSAWSHPHIIELAGGEEIAPADLVAELRDTRVIFLGEVHDHEGHHLMQLEIIRALHEQGAPLAVGLEMFRHDYQQALDGWVAGEIAERQFIPIYQRNWSRWRLYRPIFTYAREQQIPLVGLNISRVITRHVARDGFASLSEEQLADLDLPDFACIVDPAYEEFIRRALGGEEHGEIANFANFCQAQLLWDRVMAGNLARFLQANPTHRIVVLAGNGHSWQHGIPAQLDSLLAEPISHRVLLPEAAGRLDRTNLTPQDTDYLWLDFGPEGWQLYP